MRPSVSATLAKCESELAEADAVIADLFQQASEQKMKVELKRIAPALARALARHQFRQS